MTPTRAVDLLAEHAAPATPIEIARWTGMSDHFVRDDIRTGVLPAMFKRNLVGSAA